MAEERFLVTGSSGCLGAWALALLAGERTPVVAFDISADSRRPRLVASDEVLERVEFRQGDITEPETVAALVQDEGITHIVHLAALQVPFCAADPIRGAQVNVVGSVNVLEAARRSPDVRGVSYASSVAVFGPPDVYPDGIANDDSPPAPATLYGTYKQANEGTARIYAEDYGVGSVGLRPCIVYGPGRDQGLTSDTTTAMVAAVAGVPYRIGFGGGAVFQHAEDVARAFIAAARAEVAGAEVLNVGGPSALIAEVVAAIEAAVPAAAGSITFDEAPLPLPDRIDASGLDRLVGGFSYTPLDEGVRRSVAAFADLVDRGLVSPPS